ncbi:MAG: DUF4160 domain-containing protein [Planctomycetota bacterium]
MQRDRSLAKFWLARVELASSTRFAAQGLRRIAAIIERRREELLEAWHGWCEQ